MDERLTVKELAEYWKCDESTIYRLIATGKLRAIQLRSMWRIPAEEVRAYEERCLGQGQPAPPSPSSNVAGATGMSSGGSTVPHNGYLAGQKSCRKRSSS
jgi:excisionase family DNA binding protein